jgi:hypothetical protein
VHFYEAILATLAIVVWHFYQVIFDPDVYPMNWAWRDGKMPVEHYREEHGLDVATLTSVSAKPGGNDDPGATGDSGAKRADGAAGAKPLPAYKPAPEPGSD